VARPATLWPPPRTDFETEPLPEPDGIGHVGRVSALRDQCRAFVHEPVVDLSRFVVAGVTRHQELAAEGVAKLCRRSGDRSDCRHDTLFLRCARLLPPPRPGREQTQRIQLKMKIIHLR